MTDHQNIQCLEIIELMEDTRSCPKQIFSWKIHLFLNTICQEMRLQSLSSEILENGCLIWAMKTLHWKITSHWDVTPSYFLERREMKGGKRGKMKVEGRLELEGEKGRRGKENEATNKVIYMRHVRVILN